MAINASWGLGTVDRRSTTDQVLHEIRAAILAGRIKPSEQLPEVALARAFGTGRSAVREALRQLLQEGLVVAEPNRGAHVRPIGPEDVIDLYLARAAIEVAAVQQAIGRRARLQLDKLRAAQERIEQASSADRTGPPSAELIAETKLRRPIPEPNPRYSGFAQVEYEYVRRDVYPTFEWKFFDQPSERRMLEKAVERSRVALVGTAGASIRGQPAFSLGEEGDASFREIPAAADHLRLSHVGYDVPRARRDPDVVFPLALMRAMDAEGEIGELAPYSYSFMGYIPEPNQLLSDTGPAVARRLMKAHVDLVLLVPS